MPTRLNTSPFMSVENHYSGVSPQLMARTRQMWSSRGLDLDSVWRNTIGRFRGIGTLGSRDFDADSGPVDQFFMFDQAAIWVAALHAAAAVAAEMPSTRLTTPQWRALHALTFRLIEQLDAVRLLFLTELPTPTMQIARTISEDIDMTLALVSRPKLAARFVECATVEEANEFWRRHIAGGRAFKAVTEQLYRAGLEFDPSGEYAAWRKKVTAILGTAVHSSFRSPGQAGSRTASGSLREINESLYFVTLRLQEMCAYSHGLTKDFGEDLEAVRRQAASPTGDSLGHLTAQISEITVDQMRWTLANGTAQDVPLSHQVH